MQYSASAVATPVTSDIFSRRYNSKLLYRLDGQCYLNTVSCRHNNTEQKDDLLSCDKK